MESEAAVGEQAPDFGGPDATGLRVGGVEPEVVRDDHAAGFEDAQQVGTNIEANVWIKNG